MVERNETGSGNGQSSVNLQALNMLHSELARRKYGIDKNDTFSVFTDAELQIIVKSPETIVIIKAADGSAVGFEIKNVK